MFKMAAASVGLASTLVCVDVVCARKVSRPRKRSAVNNNSNSMKKHTVLDQGCWYHPGRDEYVAIIPPDELAAVRARYQAWQAHRPREQSGNRKRTRSRSGSKRRPAPAGSASTGTSGPNTLQQVSCLTHRRELYGKCNLDKLRVFVML